MNIIILQKGLNTFEAWGSITEICRLHPEIKYSTIKARKFPFEYKGYKFYKVTFRTKQNQLEL